MITEDLKTAKVKVMSKSSFYGYILMNMDFNEDSKIETMGVNRNGDCSYNSDFFSKLSKDEQIGVLSHEILHIALMSFPRVGGRDHNLWNIATDIQINYILGTDGYYLPKEGIIPKNDEITLKSRKGPLVIKDISKKTAEEIYDEINDFCDANDLYEQGFDKHDYTGTEDTRKWEKIVQDAATIGQMKGDMSETLKKLIGEIHEPKVDWRKRLKRMIKNEIPFDQSYGVFNKRSIPLRTYVPGYIKDSKVEITFVIDDSGSISNRDLSDFFSEIIGLSEEFRQNVKIRIITHDTEVHDDLLLDRVTKNSIKNLEIHGGGGTSHVEVFNYIKNKYPDTKLVAFLTDAYSDIQDVNFEDYPFKKLFLLTNQNGGDSLKGKKCEQVIL